MMRLSDDGRARLKRLEGFRAKAYIPVPGDVPTIGYGFTEGVSLGDVMTHAQADARLIVELQMYERAVSRALTIPPNQNQFDACVLLCFNIGMTGFAKSTVCKAHNRGDFEAAGRAFALWNKSGGKVYKGLVSRRAEESALYLTPMAEAPQAMPQAVDGESTPAQSPINRASVVAGGTAAAATVAETARTVADVKYSVASLGDWLLPIALMVVVGLCVYIYLQRRKQRKEGWA